MPIVHTYHNGQLKAVEGETVREFPLVLNVNGRELATLIASPHDLRFLVAGFLYLQGFVKSVADIPLLSVCTDYGIANVQIKGDLPERLKPVLTSGCGTGITFTLPQHLATVTGRSFAPEELFFLMDQLARQADRYRSHGGIHSAAVGDGSRMLLYAEDLGRHNTLDRIAGEALLKNIDLAGEMLVTSGRVSTEMAAKAAQLGISVIASRTSPTDMAVKLCNDAGITLVGYLRGGRFQVYSHPERLTLPAVKIAGVTGVILAGGQSRRMGQNKSLLPYNKSTLVESIYQQLTTLFDEILIITNTPDDYAMIPCRKVPDIYPGHGSIAGIHAALTASGTERIFVTACDMPYLDAGVIRAQAAFLGEEAVLVPESEGGLEPLHSFYTKAALPVIEEFLNAGQRRILDIFPLLTAHIIPAAEVAKFAPGFKPFRNVNTPEDYQELNR